jgi:hypothetical protein
MIGLLCQWMLYPGFSKPYATLAFLFAASRGIALAHRLRYNRWWQILWLLSAERCLSLSAVILPSAER